VRSFCHSNVTVCFSRLVPRSQLCHSTVAASVDQSKIPRPTDRSEKTQTAPLGLTVAFGFLPTLQESKSSAKQSNNSKKSTSSPNRKRPTAMPSGRRARNEEMRNESSRRPSRLTLTKDVRGRCYVISEQDVQRDNERPQSPAVFSRFSLVAVFFLLGRRESRTAPSRFGRPFTCTRNPMREGDAEEAE
jgi:hypothetical protein